MRLRLPNPNQLIMMSRDCPDNAKNDKAVKGIGGLDARLYNGGSKVRYLLSRNGRQRKVNNSATHS